MSAKYGVNKRIGSKAPRGISIVSQTSIFIVGTVILTELSKELQDKLKAQDNFIFYGDSNDALKDFENSTGTLRGALDGVTDQNVTCPIILSIVPITKAQSEKSPEAFYEDDKIKSAVIKAVQRLDEVEAIFALEPDLAIAPRFSHDKDVRAELKSQGNKFDMTTYSDLNVSGETEAIKKMKTEFGSKRIIGCFPYVQTWDTKLDKSILEPLSPRIAGMRAWKDAVWEHGYSDSMSNQIIQGISGLSEPIKFKLGQDCMADRLRDAGITTIINKKGYRTWGEFTTELDSTWKPLVRVRIFDRIAKACQEGIFYAIDKKASLLGSARESVDAFLRELIGAGVLLGKEVVWNKEMNTLTTITKGVFFLDVDFQDVPTTVRIDLNVNFVNSYGDQLLKAIS